MLKRFIAAACLCAATVAEAEPGRLSGQEITGLVAGATVEIDTPLGTKLPVRYTVDGKMSGQARDLASYLGAASDTGRWWVTSDQLCHRWNRWFNSEPQCLRLTKKGRTIHWHSRDGNSGTAVVAVPAPIQTASVQPSAQVETKMHIAAPAPSPANSLVAATPAETLVGADRLQSLKSVEQKPMTEAPPNDAAVIQTPSTRAVSSGGTQASNPAAVYSNRRRARRRPQRTQGPVNRVRCDWRTGARQPRRLDHRRVPVRLVSRAAPVDERLGQPHVSHQRGAVLLTFIASDLL